MSAPAPASVTGAPRFAHAWRALRHRNFRLFFFGQGTSLIGTWMTRLATAWLVYHLTHSALLLGVVGFAGQITCFLAGPVAGVWVERVDRRRLLVWTQFAAALQSFALAALALSGVVTFGEVVALAATQGLINAFDMPGRQAFLVQMVADPNDLGNAIAINSSMATGARLVGPAVAGLIIAALGTGWCFLLDGISYFAVIASLLVMRPPARPGRRAPAAMRAELRDGWNYVRLFHPIRMHLLLFALMSLMGYSYMVLLPIFAGDVLHGGARTLGWLTAASGAGALVAALSLAVRKSVLALPRTVAISAALLGASLVLFGFSHVLWLSLAAMGLVGFGLTQCAAASNTVIQSLVAEDMRGRVMSYYTMSFFGAAPFGSLIAGYLAHAYGATVATSIAGACCVVGAGLFALQLPRIEAAAKPILAAKRHAGAATPPGAIQARAA